jgi:ATP-dependent RNA helicase DeaD
LVTFKKLGLSDEVLKVLEELGFETPTEIQTDAIPWLLEGQHDFIGLAQTGTGKTGAFGLPLIELIDAQDPSTQALVLAPTRELGQQIAEQLNTFSKYLYKLNVLPVYGGAAISNQIKALKRPQHIIIATPGRLIDLIKRKAVKLDQLKFLVLDEADEMLNMGFKEDLEKIMSYTPESKHTWLFSATMPDDIRKIVNKYMDDPLEVKVNVNHVVNTNIVHQYTILKQADRKTALTRLLDINEEMRGLVFCRTKRETQALAEELVGMNYKSDALHGDLSQAQRDRVMKRFKAHELQVLVATDVAARGIDVNDLTHVIHYSLPDDRSYYTHRSGRTARAGKEGISLAFINSREKYKLEGFEKKLGISFEQILIPKSEDIIEVRIENWCKRILETRTKGELDPLLLEKALLLFGNLSKEELIAKILKFELDKLNIENTEDINQTSAPKHSQERTRDRGGRRGGSGGRGRTGSGRRSESRRGGSHSKPFPQGRRSRGKKGPGKKA